MAVEEEEVEALLLAVVFSQALLFEKQEVDMAELV